jgi:hypothetical protein
LSFNDRTTVKQINLGRRDDGSLQLITLFNSGEYYVDSLLQKTYDAWEKVKVTSSLDKLTIFVEGKVRNPDLSLTDEEIFKRLSEPDSSLSATCNRILGYTSSNSDAIVMIASNDPRLEILLGDYIDQVISPVADQREGTTWDAKPFVPERQQLIAA